MSFHALAVDDNPDILEDVQDRLECLGHTCDGVACMTSARIHLTENTYSYILLDLEIPVRYGRKSRIANGQNLLREIRAMEGYEDIPIIIITSHGHKSPDLAVDVLRHAGANDFVKKPFLDSGQTLENAIKDALAVSGRSHPGAATRSGLLKDPEPQQFECGEMVFSESRVELCGVRICGGSECGMIRRILDALRHKNAHGRYVHYDGNELARRVGCARGQNGVAAIVRRFRDHVCKVMLAEANIQIDRLHDIILNDRCYGYRLSPKITVRETGEPVKKPNHDTVDGDDDGLNKRQQWVLEKVQVGEELRKGDIVSQFRCSDTTASRDLRDLRRRNLIEFVGPVRTGYWRVGWRVFQGSESKLVCLPPHS